MELIRLILRHYETGEHPPELAEYDESEVFYNCLLMKDADLIDATFIEGNGVLPHDIVNVRLTWAGHDFLDATRDDTIWRKAKDKILIPGVSWTFGIFVEYLKQEARRKLLGDGSSGG